MLTLEKYYDCADDAITALTATTDQRDYRLGIMFNTDTGDTFQLTIRGKEEFQKFAAALSELLEDMADVTE